MRFKARRLNHIRKKSDKQTFFSADVLLKLGRTEEAGRVYRKLIDRNQENLSYYRGLEKVSDFGIVFRLVSHEQLFLNFADLTDIEKSGDRLYQMYQDHMMKYPRAMAPRRLPLNFLTGEKYAHLPNLFVLIDLFLTLDSWSSRCSVP